MLRGAPSFFDLEELTEEDQHQNHHHYTDKHDNHHFSSHDLHSYDNEEASR